MPVESALDLIQDGACVASSSAGLIGYPDYIVSALEERFLAENHPRGLTIYSGCGHGVPFLHEGDERYAHPGFLKRIISAHPKPTPGICKLIDTDQIEAYSLPQGVMQHLYRSIGAREPGLISKIGLHTYIDPRIEGGKLNNVTKEDICKIVEIDGEEFIYYKAFPVNVSLIRATTADEHGNLTIEEEALKLELLELALAAKACGGKVIAQVKYVVETGTLSPKSIVVPGELVDAIVVVDDETRHHRQTAATLYSPYLSGEAKAPASNNAEPPETLNPEDIVCRRAAFELFPGALVNVGVGIGAGIGGVASYEGIVNDLTFTIELGAIGGQPCNLADFGSSKNATAYIAHPSMFDLYHGGNLDITFLGAAQVDREGNVNSSKFNGHSTGQGGFIDISQTSRKVVICTYFCSKGLKMVFSDGAASIAEEGKIRKFVDQVDQITFSGRQAALNGQEVLFVTERCVFRLTGEGLEITEIAPGVDLERDILQNMGFVPLVSPNLKQMDKRIFEPGVMGIAKLFQDYSCDN